MTEQAMDWGQDEDLSKIDMGSFKALCERLWNLRAEHELLEAQAKEKGKLVEELKAKVQAHMEAANLDKYHVPGFGLLYTQNRFSVKMPREDAGRQALFDYLKAKDVYDTMITINFQTLNSFYKAELEAAVEAGDSAFKMPGVAEAGYVKTLAMKKA